MKFICYDYNSDAEIEFTANNANELAETYSVEPHYFEPLFNLSVGQSHETTTSSILRLA